MKTLYLLQNTVYDKKEVYGVSVNRRDVDVSHVIFFCCQLERLLGLHVMDIIDDGVGGATFVVEHLGSQGNHRHRQTDQCSDENPAWWNEWQVIMAGKYTG